MKSKNLLEGLKELDLDNLVIPMLSLDEFESKIEDDAIVIGFYVMDSDPADDLNRFIQKSPVILLDTDVSPAPNEDGYFMVFVEVDRDEMFPNKLKTILEEIQNLVGIDSADWSFTAYGHDGIFEATDENIHVLIRTESIEDLKAEALKEGLLGFFQPSALDTVNLTETLLSVTRGRTVLGGNISFFGPEADLIESVLGKPLQLTEEATRLCRQWENTLGAGWVVHQIQDQTILSNVSSPNVLVLDK